MENKHQHQWSDANPQSAICTMCGMRIGDYDEGRAVAEEIINKLRLSTTYRPVDLEIINSCLESRYGKGIEILEDTNLTTKV